MTVAICCMGMSGFTNGSSTITGATNLETMNLHSGAHKFPASLTAATQFIGAQGSNTAASFQLPGSSLSTGMYSRAGSGQITFANNGNVSMEITFNNSGGNLDVGSLGLYKWDSGSAGSTGGDTGLSFLESYKRDA